MRDAESVRKQIQGWSREKREVLIAGGFDKLSHPNLSLSHLKLSHLSCTNSTHANRLSRTNSTQLPEPVEGNRSLSLPKGPKGPKGSKGSKGSKGNSTYGSR